MEHQGRSLETSKCTLSKRRLLWQLLMAGWIISSFTAFAAPILAQSAPPCAEDRAGDFVVGRTPGEALTMTGSRTFPGRIVVTNRSTLRFLNADLEIHGDILLCEAATLRIEHSRVSVHMQYSGERTFRAWGGSRLEFAHSFFTNPDGFATSMDLADSTLSMSFVNRVDLDRTDLAPQIVGWTTALINATADISDTNYLGEITALFGPSALRFIRSAGLIFWFNFRDADSGGAVVPPSTDDTPLTWRFDRNTAGVHGIHYSIAIEDSRFIISGVLIWIYNGVPHADVTLRDGSAAIGLIFINESGVEINNLREGLHEDFSPRIPDRRVKLERLRVLSWNIYAGGSDITITDSEIGEIFSDSLPQRTARVEVAGSRLTGNGGFYQASNADRVTPSPVLIIKDSDIRSRIVATDGGVVLLDGSRVRSSAQSPGSELIADGGALVVLGSELASPLKTVIKGGAIWRASLDASVTLREGRTRWLTLRGDATILSERPAFSHYTVEYAAASEASERHLLHRSSHPVLGGALFTGPLPDGLPAGHYRATIMVHDMAGTAYSVSRILPVPDARDVSQYSIPPGGVASFRTAGRQSPLQVGSLTVYPNPQTAAPRGAAIFSFTRRDRVVTEAAVPETTPTTRARLFVDQSEQTSTGVAVANPNGQDARVRLTLRSADGATVLGQAALTVPAYGQMPRFVNELIPGLPATFQGSLSIESNVPMATVTLKSSINERQEPIFTTASVADLNAAPSTAAMTLPQIADGRGLGTEVVLINTTDQTLAGRVRFFSPDGSALRVAIGDRTDEAFAYTIAAHGIFNLKTAGRWDGLQTGYAVVEPASGQAAPAASVRFRYAEDGVLVWEAGYAAEPPSTRWRVFVERGEGTDTGMALANPGDRTALVTLRLLAGDGRAEVARRTITLPPRAHIARFLSEIIEGWSGPFYGTLDITSREALAVVALRSRVNARGVPLMSTLPVLDLTQPPSWAPLVFPHLADGEGFMTQIILLNPTSAEVNGSLSFFSSDGQPQALEVDSRPAGFKLSGSASLRRYLWSLSSHPPGDLPFLRADYLHHNFLPSSSGRIGWTSSPSFRCARWLFSRVTNRRPMI